MQFDRVAVSPFSQCLLTLTLHALEQPIYSRTIHGNKTGEAGFSCGHPVRHLSHDFLPGGLPYLTCPLYLLLIS
jgi:hypothetical protein